MGDQVGLWKPRKGKQNVSRKKSKLTADATTSSSSSSRRSRDMFGGSKKGIPLKPLKTGKMRGGSSGGAYEHVRSFNKLVKTFKLSFEREADHTPPKSTYKDTPFDLKRLSELKMPAVSIEKNMHRKGVTTTGSYGVTVEYRENVIKSYLKKGDFKNAMIESFRDQKNAAPHSIYYAQSQEAAARYAHSVVIVMKDGSVRPLLDKQELDEVLTYVWRETYPAPSHETTHQNDLSEVTAAEASQLRKVGNPSADSSVFGGQRKSKKPVNQWELDPLGGERLTESTARSRRASLSVAGKVSGTVTRSSGRDTPMRID